MAVREDVARWCMVRGLLEKSLVWRNKQNAQRCDSRMTLTRIRVQWEKDATPNTICIGTVLSSPLYTCMKDKSSLSSMNCIVMMIKMVNIKLFMLIR